MCSPTLRLLPRLSAARARYLAMTDRTGRVFAARTLLHKVLRILATDHLELVITMGERGPGHEDGPGPAARLRHRAGHGGVVTRILAWLTGWDDPTCRTIASLM